MNLLKTLRDPSSDEPDTRYQEVIALRQRLDSVYLSEAQDPYRIASESSGLPDLYDPSRYLEHLFVLFGGEFVAITIDGLRIGRKLLPAAPRIHYEPREDLVYPADEFYDYNACDPILGAG